MLGASQESSIGSRGSSSTGRRGRRRLNQEEKRTADYSSEDYDVIRNDLKNPELREQFSEDHLFKHGTPNRPFHRVGSRVGAVEQHYIQRKYRRQCVPIKFRIAESSKL